MSSKEKLAQALHSRGLFEMERKAREGYYDDYQSPLSTPKIKLVSDLRAEAKDHKDPVMKFYIEKLADQVMQGEFNSTKEESEAWFEGRKGRSGLYSSGVKLD